MKTNYLLVGLAIGFFSGYIAKEISQYRHTYILNDLTVIRKYEPEEKYLMAFNDTHLSFTTKICDDFKPNFPEGATLKLLVYEDRGDCWSVADTKLGYKYRRERGE